MGRAGTTFRRLPKTRCCNFGEAVKALHEIFEPEPKGGIHD